MDPLEHYRQDHRKGRGQGDSKHRVMGRGLNPDPREAGVVTVVVECDPS
jgi:hypothetical protein